MFHNVSSLTDSIKKSIEAKSNWNYSHLSISEFNQNLVDIDNNERFFDVLWQGYRELLKYAPLKGEFIIASYGSWYVVTNYRFTLNLHLGQFSIPLSAIVKFGDYRSSKVDLNDKALAGYAKLNEGKKSSWLDNDLPSIDNDYFVWFDQSGDFQRLGRSAVNEWIKPELLSLAVSKSYWQDLSEEETSSIYFSADRAKNKFSYEPFSFDALKSELGHVDEISSPKMSKEKKTSLGNNILAITSKSLFDKMLSKTSDNTIKIAIDSLQNGNLKGFDEIVQESKNKDFDSDTTKTLVAIQKYFLGNQGNFTSYYPDFMKIKEFSLQKSDFNESAETLFESNLKEMVLAFSLSMILEKEKHSLGLNSFIEGMKVGAISGLIGRKNKALSTTIEVAGFAAAMSGVYSRLKAINKISDFKSAIKSNSEALDAINKDFNLVDSVYDLNVIVGNDMSDKILSIPLIASSMSKYESPVLLTHFDKPFLSKGNAVFTERLSTYINNVQKKKPTLFSYLSIFGGFLISMTVLFGYEQILLGFFSFWFFLYFIPFGKRSFLRIKF